MLGNGDTASGGERISITPKGQQNNSGGMSGLTLPMLKRAFAEAIMNDKQKAEFALEKECNFAIWPKEIGRFRVNVFLQRHLTQHLHQEPRYI